MDKHEVKNLRQVRALVKRYRRIDLKELQASGGMLEDEDKPWNALRCITSFNTFGCTLCEYNCGGCLHTYAASRRKLSVIGCHMDTTYYAMLHARSYEELLKAIKHRADYLKDLLDRFRRDEL